MQTYRNSIYINLGGNATESQEPCADSSSQGQVPQVESISAETHAKEDASLSSSPNEQPEYYAEICVCPEDTLPAAPSHLRDKGFDDKSESTRRRKCSRCCGIETWLFLLVVILIVIAIIVMSVLLGNFQTSVRNESEAIWQDVESLGRNGTTAIQDLKTIANWLEHVNRTNNLLRDEEFRMMDLHLHLSSVVINISLEWKKSHDNLFYKVVHDNASYETAVANCKGFGGRLASRLLQEKPSQRLTKFFKSSSNTGALWIGYRSMNLTNDSRWTWTYDGSTKNDTLAWIPSETQRRIENACAAFTMDVVRSNKTKKFEIRTENCDRQLAYLCEIEPITILRQGYGRMHI